MFVKWVEFDNIMVFEIFFVTVEEPRVDNSLYHE